MHSKEAQPLRSKEGEGYWGKAGAAVGVDGWGRKKKFLGGDEHVGGKEEGRGEDVVCERSGGQGGVVDI